MPPGECVSKSRKVRPPPMPSCVEGSVSRSVIQIRTGIHVSQGHVLRLALWQNMCTGSVTYRSHSRKHNALCATARQIDAPHPGRAPSVHVSGSSNDECWRVHCAVSITLCCVVYQSLQLLVQGCVLQGTHRSIPGVVTVCRYRTDGFCEFCVSSTTIPDTCVSFVAAPVPYRRLL